jgi:UDP-N-acetylglucosamine transferase subunit ALG13
MDIFVTVGMSRWPFDRLLKAIGPLCESHNIFAQIGVSDIKLPCSTCRFIPFPDFLDHIEKADIVITHAGNTVRLVQRRLKVPIAMAREGVRGEMANDHQVKYLRYEEQNGRVIALWDGADLPKLVENHRETQFRMLATRPLVPKVSGKLVADILNRLCAQWIK